MRRLLGLFAALTLLGVAVHAGPVPPVPAPSDPNNSLYLMTGVRDNYTAFNINTDQSEEPGGYNGIYLAVSPDGTHFEFMNSSPTVPTLRDARGKMYSTPTSAALLYRSGKFIVVSPRSKESGINSFDVWKSSDLVSWTAISSITISGSNCVAPSNFFERSNGQVYLLLSACTGGGSDPSVAVMYVSSNTDATFEHWSTPKIASSSDAGFSGFNYTAMQGSTSYLLINADVGTVLVSTATDLLTGWSEDVPPVPGWVTNMFYNRDVSNNSANVDFVKLDNNGTRWRLYWSDANSVLDGLNFEDWSVPKDFSQGSILSSGTVSMDFPLAGSRVLRVTDEHAINIVRNAAALYMKKRMQDKVWIGTTTYEQSNSTDVIMSPARSYPNRVYEITDTTPKGYQFILPKSVAITYPIPFGWTYNVTVQLPQTANDVRMVIRFTTPTTVLYTLKNSSSAAITYKFSYVWDGTTWQVSDPPHQAN